MLVVAMAGAFSFSASATHNYGGYIYFNHISGMTYEIHVVTYTDLNAAQADRCELMVQFGDGTSQMVQRANGIACGPTLPNCNHCGEAITATLKVNEYIVQHTYSAANSYLISVEDVGRNAGILNIPNAISQDFYIASELNILSSAFSNNSPTISASNMISVLYGTEIHQNLSAVDIDGDILSYELVAAKGRSGQDIIGYVVPDSVRIDRVSGDITWNYLPKQGAYVLTVKINQCRDNVDIGYTLVDFQVMVISAPAQPQFTGLASWPTDSSGLYRITLAPNDSVELDLTFEDTYSGSAISLDAESETFQTNALATFDSIGSGPTYITKKFKWKPDATNLRCAPYLVTFKGVSTLSMGSFPNQVTLMINVWDQSTQNCSTVCGAILSKNEIENTRALKIVLQPNPATDEVVVKLMGDAGKLALKLYDLRGKKVLEMPVSGPGQFRIRRNNLPAGLYIYHLSKETEIVGSGKLIFVD